LALRSSSRTPKVPAAAFITWSTTATVAMYFFAGVSGGHLGFAPALDVAVQPRREDDLHVQRIHLGDP